MAKSAKRKSFPRILKEKIPLWMRNKYFIAALSFLIWMFFFDRNNIISQAHLRMKLSDYRQKKSYYTLQIAGVKKEKQELMTNKNSLEKFARERYMMKKDDEDLFVIVPKAEKK